MLTENLAQLFERDLQKLAVEIRAYKDESHLWVKLPGTANSAGNLCLHILGNLQHFVGAILGQTGYRRERPLEFSRTNVPVQQLLDEIRTTIDTVGKVIRKLDAAKISEDEYPEQPLGDPMTVEYFLLHLLTHLSYHLGQINYHRRLAEPS